jgi:glutathione S-transferase
MHLDTIREDAMSAPSAKPYTLYAWHLSYFAGKMRAYLVYKKVPFVEVPVSYRLLVGPVKRNTGASVMPTMTTPEGRWLQDTRHIIDTLEPLYPTPSIFPTTPRRRIAAELIEAWGDEWWIPIAMHTRWTYTENYALFERDAGDALAPWAPRFVKNYLVSRVARLLRGYCPRVGIIPSQFAMMEEWSLRMLDLLDSHFAAAPYVLGDHPTLADFGLQSTMYGHLGRDPWPKREWIDPRRNLRAWVDRMATLDHEAVRARYGTPTPDAPDDAIPPTIEPVLRTICREFLPMVQGILAETRKAIAAEPGADRPLSRLLGAVSFPMGEHTFTRHAIPFTLYKIQGLMDAFDAMPEQDRATVRDWLRGLGGEGFLDLDIPRLERVAMQVRVRGDR